MNSLTIRVITNIVLIRNQKSHTYYVPMHFTLFTSPTVSQLIIVIPSQVIVIIRCPARWWLILMLVVGRTVARVVSGLLSVWCHIRPIYRVFISKLVCRSGMNIGSMGEPRTQILMGWMRFCVNMSAW